MEETTRLPEREKDVSGCHNHEEVNLKKNDQISGINIKLQNSGLQQ